MPWCEPCSRFLSPATVTADGRCPACGRPVEAGRARPPAAAADGRQAAGSAPVARDGLAPVPWHFKLLCAAAATYLGWRAVQGVDWLARHL
jgi:hypothetical protein